MTTDLAAVLAAAIAANRDQINADAERFAGRIPFHVNLDVNLRMQRVVVTVEPCKDESCGSV